MVVDNPEYGGIVMPFRSEAQRRYLWARHPGVAEEFADKTPRGKKLPYHVKHKKEGAMSTEAQVSPAIEAHRKVMEDIYHPVFFNKLAQAGIVPQNGREAEQLLYLGRTLFATHEEKRAADAGARGTFLDFAVSRLDGLLQSPGVGDRQVKQAAAALMADAATRDAAVVLAESIDATA